MLLPVRGSRRPGVDRGVIVVLVAAALIGLLVTKPWGPDTPPQSNPSGGASPAFAAIQPTSPAARPTSAPEALSLKDVTARLRTVPHDPDTALIMSFWRPDPISVSYLDERPRTTDMGADCADGALLGEGTDAIGVTLPRPSWPSRPSQAARRSHVTQLQFLRLFDRQDPVSVPVVSEVDPTKGIAVVRPDGVEWAVGHYALTMDTVGRSGTVAICVGHMTRLVDYSLVTFVPEILDDAAARKELLRELAAL